MESEVKKPRTRTKAKKEETPSRKEVEQVQVEEILKEVKDVDPIPLVDAPQPHILSISDENGLPLLFIGENFKNLGLESKIAVITHLKGFITSQKTDIIKMVEDL